MRKLMWGAAAAALFAGGQADALVINLNNTGGVEQGSAAYLGFRAAADFWQRVLTSDATVNLNVGFSSTGFSSANIIGQTASTRFTGVTVEDVFAQMDATGNSQLDAIAQASRPTTTTVNSIYGGTTQAVAAITQKPRNAANQGVLQNVKTNGVETTSNREYDNDGSRNNYDLRVNAAVLKALGYDLTGLYNGVDATVTFNSAFNFDLDPRDGIGIGQIDFTGTAIHEIGHALGFVSGVDTYDTATATTTTNYDNQALMSTLDLFRYSNDITGIAPGDGYTLDWSVGNAVNGRPFFSFDGKTMGLAAYGGDAGYFSTGQTNGDGNQASHWQDTPYVALPGDQGPGSGRRCLAPSVPSRGIMDPTFAPCEEGTITSLDLAAFDAMGWNVSYNVLADTSRTFTSGQAFAATVGQLPEPATWAQMVLGFGAIGFGLRQRRKASVRFA